MRMLYVATLVYVASSFASALTLGPSFSIENKATINYGRTFCFTPTAIREYRDRCDVVVCTEGGCNTAQLCTFTGFDIVYQMDNSNGQLDVTGTGTLPYTNQIMYDGEVIASQYGTSPLAVGEVQSITVHFRMGDRVRADMNYWPAIDGTQHQLTIILDVGGANTVSSYANIRYCGSPFEVCSCGVNLVPEQGLRVGGVAWNWGSSKNCLYPSLVTYMRDGAIVSPNAVGAVPGVLLEIDIVEKADQDGEAAYAAGLTAARPEFRSELSMLQSVSGEEANRTLLTHFNTVSEPAFRSTV
eukprot:4079649-Pyramimonas_sp.AAC.1